MEADLENERDEGGGKAERKAERMELERERREWSQDFVEEGDGEEKEEEEEEEEDGREVRREE